MSSRSWTDAPPSTGTPGQEARYANKACAPGGEPSFHFSFNPGTYVLQLFGYDDPVHVLYDLVLETSAPYEDDEYEDNDLIDEAQPITPGHSADLTGCYLDADFHTFDVVAGQTVTLTATEHHC